MLGKIAAVAAQLVEAAGSVVGVRAGTQEPRFDIEKRVNGMEIRRYEARIAAQTTVTGVEASARSQGFRRLAGYIFGGNHKKSKIAMTAPVSQERGTTNERRADRHDSAGISRSGSRRLLGDSVLHAR